MASAGSILQQLFDIAKKVAKDPQNKVLLTSATAFLKGLQRPDVQQAVTDIRTKQATLIGTGTLATLPTDQLVLYAALGDAQVILLATDLAGAMAADVSSWLIDHALPILEELARLALPMLVAL